MEKPEQLRVIIANLPGSTIDVLAREDEPIQFIMDRITNKLTGEEIMDNSGLDFNRRMYLDGKLINNYGESMRYYNLFGQTWTYQSNCKSGIIGGGLSKNISDKRNGKRVIQFFVVGLSGNTISCRLRSDQTIYDLKHVLTTREGAPTDQQMLVHSGKQLENDGTLAYYNITNDSSIYLLLRLLGGRPFPMLEFADVSNEKGQSKRKLFDTAPRGRFVSDGINIEIQCQCTDYVVIHPYGFGYFDLRDTLTPCPNCGSNTHPIPITVGFISCHYRIYGIKKDGSQYKSNWIRVAPEYQYQIYDTSKKVNWRRLGIEARPLTASIKEPCTICLENLDENEKGNAIVTLSCSHQFHSNCIASWKLSCPVCRAISAQSSL
ncbi:hypothetical protein BDA99DRAFT_504841 [Phascolomyces articulosus]|uniref:Uncharacterized protein n=1 Tax=Phascolomyces articulosus TaxID=60185 RepID=A0AAD5PFD3_9FUNG|nr:hypothetical protein BDA99DRAFT_504841 [Phascolomyces articulosus]